MTSIEVRPAQNGDVGAMAAIYVDAAREGWAHIFGEQSLKTLRPPVDRLRAELASTDPRQQVVVADREGRVIAFAVVRPSHDEDADSTLVGELDQFYSDPAVWGQGVGRKLMTAAIATLRERGFTEATLWTSKDNHRPRRIYEAAGWRLDGATRDKQWREASVRDLRYRISLEPEQNGTTAANSEFSGAQRLPRFDAGQAYFPHSTEFGTSPRSHRRCRLRPLCHQGAGRAASWKCAALSWASVLECPLAERGGGYRDLDERHPDPCEPLHDLRAGVSEFVDHRAESAARSGMMVPGEGIHEWASGTI